jgi:hypothetical protein
VACTCMGLPRCRIRFTRERQIVAENVLRTAAFPSRACCLQGGSGSPSPLTLAAACAADAARRGRIGEGNRDAATIATNAGAKGMSFSGVLQAALSSSSPPGGARQTRDRSAGAGRAAGGGDLEGTALSVTGRDTEAIPTGKASRKRPPARAAFRFDCCFLPSPFCESKPGRFSWSCPQMRSGFGWCARREARAY